MSENSEKKKGIIALIAALFAKHKKLAAAIVLLIAAAITTAAVMSGKGGGNSISGGTELLEKFWPEAFVVKADDEPPFEDDPERTNNAFNVIDFGEQGSNGWFYRYGDYRKPERSKRVSNFDGEKYFQPGANGLEIKNGFVHTAEGIAPILEWRAARNGKVDVTVAYVKNVNGDANPSYPDGVQLLVYKGNELQKFETVPISTTEENFALIELDDLDVKKLESLYFVVNPNRNNAYDGGSFYAAVSDANNKQTIPSTGGRTDNNANSTNDFGKQGSNGWLYMAGTDPSDCHPVSHEKDGEYIDRTSPSLSIKKDFIHPSLNHNAILAWNPAVTGNVDVRLRYTKFEQNDGMPEFPDGVRVKIYKNDKELYNEYVDVPDSGEVLIKKRIPVLSVTPLDMLYFMVDPEGNSSYDGGNLDVTIIDINGTSDESAVVTDSGEIRQNIADVKDDFGPQGSNGWIFQSGYGDDPFNARNMTPFDSVQDRYFASNWLEIKRDYVNTGEHDSSAVIKWRVAQNGTISIRASYTKLKNEDKNPAWPDGTRVSLYANSTLLARQTFEPLTNQEVTKRLDISSLNVRKGDYITMVVNGIDNNAYDGGKYEFAINSLSGLVGNTEKNVPATYDGPRTNFASTLDDFNGIQGYNGWYYQYGFNIDPFCAVNIEKCENNEKFYTDDGVEIKKDYIVPAKNGKSANVKWVAAENGVINIDLLYTKLLNEDANPAWPDGVTVYLMKNGTVLKKQYFAPRTDIEVTGDLSTYGVSVNKGDCITMIVDPGENPAYDGGKYLFVIEDANKTPVVAAGNHDNFTSLNALSSINQGTDGWWFLEGSEPSNAKVLTKKTDDGLGYESRRSEGLVMKKDMVHTGSYLDPIYQWLPGEDGRINISGRYVKWGQEDSNPDWPDGVTLKVWHEGKLLLSQKVTVKRGDGNDNVIDFSFNNRPVKRGDKLSFQICHDGNWAWDGGNLSVVITPVEPAPTPSDRDNNTVLLNDFSGRQGYEGWYYGFCDWDGKNFSMIAYDSANSRYYDGSKIELKKDYVAPGNGKNAAYKWIAAKDGKINVKGSYTKFANSSDKNADGTCVRFFLNGEEKKWLGAGGNFSDEQTVGFDEIYDVKAGDVIIFAINPEGNDILDSGRLAVSISDVKPLPDPYPENRTNNTVLYDDFGDQGYQGWYYGSCDWNGTAFKAIQNKDGDAYLSDENLTLKKDFIHPGVGGYHSAAYKWVVAEDGTIKVEGEYVKFANSAEAAADGVTFRIVLNGEEKEWLGNTIQGNFAEDRTVTFNKTFAVKAGDEIIFAINPEGNNAYDGGRLAIRISEAVQDDRTNNANLKDDFSDKQGNNGWYYGMADWDGKNFAELSYDAANSRYMNNGAKPELKADFVEPGSGRNAAYKWIAAKEGTICVEGEYVKFANAEGSGTVFRIRLNGEEKKFIGMQGTGDERSESFNETFEVKAGDELMFLIDPEGDDAYDGGRLTVKISEGGSSEPERENSANLKDDFSDKQGNNGWYYGMADWDGKNFAELPYDAANSRYMNNGAKPELKADFVEPGSGRNAAYKWIAAKDGMICVEGEYVKFANAEGSGTVFRIRLNGEEKKFIGMQGTGDERSESFNETFEVKAGDELMFLIDPEGDDAYDGGRLTVKISEGGSSEPERENSANLKDDFSDKQGNNGWYYGMADWDGKNFAELSYDAANSRYMNSGAKPELKADFVEPGSGRNAAYKWIAAKDGTIRVEGEYVKFANAEGSGTVFRIRLNGEEKKFIGMQGTGDERSESFNETFEVKTGDELMFLIDPEGDDAYDGGRLTVKISEVGSSEPEKEYSVSYVYEGEYPEAVMNTLPSDDQKYKDGDEVTAKAPSSETVEGEKDGKSGTWTFDGWDAASKTVQGADIEFKGTWTFTAEEAVRTNDTVLKDDFSNEQGRNGWYYGMADWDGKNFAELPYDAENNRYMNNGAKPELKADYVEPGSGRNAAYKWIAAKDGTIRVEGEYVKFACTEGTGTAFRIRLNGEEKKFIGMQGTGAERSESFDETLSVKAGDEVMFLIDPEGDDAYDGGRLSVTIRTAE